MINPSKILNVCLIGSHPLAGAPTCDDAIDLDYVPAQGEASLAKLLSDYERSRTEEDMAKLPLVPGKSLTIFETWSLTAQQFRYVQQGRTDTDVYTRAFLCGCHKITPGDGGKEHTMKIPSDAIAARLEWVDDVAFPLYGQDAIDEIGRVILERAKVGPRAKLPFSLPPGLMLPR